MILNPYNYVAVTECFDFFFLQLGENHEIYLYYCTILSYMLIILYM